MNFKWFRNKLTFVIIPEANGSVVRVNLSRAVIGGTIFLLLLVVGASCWVYYKQLHTSASTYLRATELHGQTARLEQDLKGKNATIEKLQNEIHSLSRQAAEVHSKMEEMKRLEQELQRLTPGAVSAAVSASASAGAEAQQGAVAAGGMGGPAYAVSVQEASELASATGVRYDQLHQEMSRLMTGFSRSKQLLQQRQEKLRRTPSIWPTVSRTVTSPYGYRRDPFTNKLSFHRGIDIAGKLGDPVFAGAGGSVLTVGNDKLHGHNVVIEHTGGLRTWYMHLNSVAVHEGDAVDKGQRIGRLGTTGRSTGPHLHYEVLLSGKSTDPDPYLPARSGKEKSSS